MHTNLARGTHVVRRLGVLALLATAALAAVALSPATAWGQLYGRPVAQPFFDFPNWARWSDCRPGPLAWGYDVFPGYGPIDCGACGMPDSVACDVDFVAHRPSTWYASADFAPMTMDYGSDVVVARTFIPADAGPPVVPASLGPIQLTSDDLKPEFDSGGKFTLGRRIFGCYRLEGTYLGSYSWESAAIARSSLADLSSVLGGFPDPVDVGETAFDGNTQVTVAQGSSMQSAELNLRYWVSMPPGPFDVSILVGGRYMNIDDRFRIVGTNAAGDNDLLVETENEMWGLQLGIQGSCLKTTRFWIDYDFKGGIYGNEATLFYDLIATDGALSTTFEGDANRTSFVGDISIVGHWQMTPWLVFNLGYQAVFAEGVALGLSNVANPPFLDGIDDPATTQFDDSGRLVYHGPVIGLMGIW